MHEEVEGNDLNVSHHEEFKAYNEVEGKEEENDITPGTDGEKVKKIPCKQLWRNMDKTVIKPFLIYNYSDIGYKTQMKNEVLGVEPSRKS
jgi:hypothetical protein